MSPNEIKAIIFDFDELLFDNTAAWDKAYYKFLEVKGLKEDNFGDWEGGGLRDFIEVLKKYGLRGPTDKLMSQYRRYFYKFSSQEAVLMPGAKELLEKAKAKNLIIALTSGGHKRRKLVEMLKLQGILNYFSLIISSDDVALGKPAPDVYLEALRRLHLKGEECVVLEDSVNGVKSAKAANVPVWGVNPNDKIRKNLEKAGADRVYASLLEVEL